MKNLVDIDKNYKGNKLDFIHGAEWMQARMIKKACEWLHSNCYIDDEYLDRFKQAMEENI